MYPTAAITSSSTVHTTYCTHECVVSLIVLTLSAKIGTVLTTILLQQPLRFFPTDVTMEPPSDGGA